MPASSAAFLIASQARASSVRPEFFEYSVSPIPTTAALSRRPSGTGQADAGGSESGSSAPSHGPEGPMRKNVLGFVRPSGPPGSGQSGVGSLVIASPR